MTPEFTSRYRLEEKVGQGGMGIVYRASDLRLFEKPVAVKMLRPEKAADPMLRKRLEVEARAAATLNHPAIATLLDFETTGETPYLVYEFVNGKTLRVIQADRVLPLREVLPVCIRLAEALSVAHDAGIVHRDLKPENIMMTNDGNVKILDFGLAKVMQSRINEGDVTRSELTVEGSFVGTPDYMSPEQIEGDPVDHRTDIFAIGIILYELAVKQHPYRGKTAHSTMGNILKVEPRDLSSISGTGIIPRDFARIIRKCLRKPREERYQSMRDLAVDLNEVLRELVSPAPNLDVSTRQFAIPYAWLKFMLLQGVYVTIYVATLIFTVTIKASLGDIFPIPETVSFYMITILTMCGLAMRAWTMPSVGYHHPDAGEQFRRLFPLLFLLDEMWALSPLLLGKRLGDYGFLLLGGIALMAYLPFAQKTLMESIYPQPPAGTP